VLTTHGRGASQLLGNVVTAVEWTGRDRGTWEDCLEGADAVINLAGAPIADARWTENRKRLLTDSRVQLTILDILLRELNLRLVEKGVEIEVDDEVKAWLIKEGYEPLYGARPMRRTIQRAIGDPLSEQMIKGRFKESRKIRVVLRDGAPTFIEQEAMAGV